MTELTIEQLIDDVIEDAKIYGINMNAGGNLYSSLETSRAALLSKIAEIQSSLEDEQKCHDDIATICFRTGAEIADGTSISAVKNLAKMVAQLQQESDEWQRVADELADELNEANSERFPVSWEDASETSPAWIAYNNLRDRKEIKTSPDNNK